MVASRSPSRARRALRLLLASLAALMLAAVSCVPGFDPPSKVNSLRILAVTADKPYAQPGEDVTLRMTLYDGAGDPSDPAAGPRDVQILWLGGCVDPEADQYFLCFGQLAQLLAPLANGTPPSDDLVKLDLASAASSGTPNAHEFTFHVPEDVISRRRAPPAGLHYGIVYVFFAACAGQLAPAASTAPGGGEVPDFPLQCLDASGHKLGSDSFVIGYTQVYSFADGRVNQIPPINGLLMDDEPMSEDLAAAPEVQACQVTAEERRQASCQSNRPVDDCVQYVFEAQIGDVAEVDPEGQEPDGTLLREVVWVSYFAEAGDLSTALSLVSDAKEGYQPEHHTTWVPPAEPGTYAIWAVARDQRGGSSVVRRFVVVK